MQSYLIEVDFAAMQQLIYGNITINKQTFRCSQKYILRCSSKQTNRQIYDFNVFLYSLYAGTHLCPPTPYPILELIFCENFFIFAKQMEQIIIQ